MELQNSVVMTNVIRQAAAALDSRRAPRHNIGPEASDEGN
jgi:hypothetical protein